MNVKRWSLLDPCSVFYRPNDDVLKQHSVECAPDNTISVDNISSSGKSTHPVDRLGYESSASRSAANVSEFCQTSGSAKLSSTATINSNHHQPLVRLLFIHGRTHYFRIGEFARADPGIFQNGVWVLEVPQRGPRQSPGMCPVLL